MYQFSPSSMPLLQRCIELAKQNNETNQWKQRFSQPSVFDCDLSNSSEIIEEITPITCNQENLSVETDVRIAELKTDDEKYKEIEADPMININLIVQKGSIDGNLLKRLGQNLDDASVEKLSNYVFENNLDSSFISNFFEFFLPTYFKCKNTRLSLDLFISAYKLLPVYFKILLKNILRMEIDSNILQEFVSTLSPLEQNNILIMFIECDVSVDAFIKNMFSINTCYKSCSSDDKIQNFIFCKLSEAAEKCKTDKHYGRLLLTYLQSKNDDSHLNMLQSIVEMHRSPFRRPCIKLLNEITQKK